MTDSSLMYTFTCPSCSGSFSIGLEKIPPVQARFRCPHCKKPMDFPSREEARVYASLQAKEAAAKPAAANAASPSAPARETSRSSATATATLDDPNGSAVTDATRFRVEKQGFETDVYDRRAIRNLIRTGEVVEADKVRMDDGQPEPAGELPYLRSLFNLRKTARVQPPTCCRTHTEKVAFFKCRDTGRPLCEDCSPEKKFGGTTIRVCNHCGGTAVEMVHA